MQTPQKMTLSEFGAAIQQYRDTETREGPGGLYRHKCGGVLRMGMAYLSIHNAKWKDLCCGPGRVWFFPIPYCAACETPPADNGCIHIPMTWLPDHTLDLGLGSFA